MKKSKPIDFIRIPVLEILHKILPNNLAVNKKLLKIYANNFMINKGMNIYGNIPSDKFDSKNYSMRLFFQLNQIEQHDVRFYNFWYSKDILDNWFYHFLKHHNLHNQRLNFFSVFGSKRLIKIKDDAPCIFFSGENVYWYYDSEDEKDSYTDYCLNDVDLSMGYEYIDASNYLRLPLWMLYLIPVDATYEQIQGIVAQLNDPNLRYSGRLKFASLVARHDGIINSKKEGLGGVASRQEMTQLLSQVAHIECAGKLLKNTNDLQEKFANDKHLYLQQFKFNLCPENSARHGYVTEKLFDAIQAGCIPIYSGDNNPEPEILNHDAIIFYDSNNPQITLNKVSELWQNEHLYKEFCHIPPFKAEAADRIWETLQELEKRIRVLVE